MSEQITDRAMKANPSGADTWLIEGGKRGAGRLMGRITVAGERLFYFRYTRTDGSRDTLQIGAYSTKSAPGTFTVAGARAKALEWSGLIQPSGSNANPIPNRDVRTYLAAQDEASANARQQAKEDALAAAAAQLHAEAEAKRREVTLRQVFDQWRATALTPRVKTDGTRMGRKDGGQYVAEQFTRYVFPALGERAMTKIRKAEVFVILDRLVSQNKLRTANVVLTDLKQLFRFATEREIIEASPIEAIKKERVGGADTERYRTLSEQEIRALPAALARANLLTRTELAIWLILATGVRVGEMMGAAWSDHKSQASQLRALGDKVKVKFGSVNLKTRKWYLPDTKNEREHTIHLSDFALEKFNALADLQEHNDWIFPDRSGMKPVCVRSFGKQITDRQRPGGKPMKNRSAATSALVMPGGHWTSHDLRRTASTLMSSMGFSSDVINECLNHKLADRMSRTYIQDRREGEQRLAFDALGRKLRELTHLVEGSNVMPLKPTVS